MDGLSPRDRLSLNPPRSLEIIDTTLREGQHTSLLHDHFRYYFSRTDKEDILRALIIYGVRFVELFAPVVSPKERDDFEALRAVRDANIPRGYTAERVRPLATRGAPPSATPQGPAEREAVVGRDGYTFLLAHVRCHPKDVETAIQAGADGLNFYIRTSSETQSFDGGRDTTALIKQARSLIEDVRRNHPGLILRFSGEDAFRTSEDTLFQVYDEIAPLVDRLGMPDSVGVATPASVARRVQALRDRYPGMELEGHFHDDRGLALVNTLEAVRGGVRYVNTTVLGIGERSGITSLTALLFNLYIDQELDRLEAFRLSGSYPLNVMVADKLRKLVPSKEPVGLTNRTHTAGVHQKEVLYSTSAYEAHPLHRFGVTESAVLLGPLSGWNAIHYFLKEIRYYQLDEATAKEITAVFKQRVYELAPGESPAELLEQIAEREFHLSRLALPETENQLIQRLDEPSASERPGLVGIPIQPRAEARE